MGSRGGGGTSLRTLGDGLRSGLEAAAAAAAASGTTNGVRSSRTIYRGRRKKPSESCCDRRRRALRSRVGVAGACAVCVERERREGDGAEEGNNLNFEWFGMRIAWACVAIFEV